MVFVDMVQKGRWSPPQQIPILHDTYPLGLVSPKSSPGFSSVHGLAFRLQDDFVFDDKGSISA